LPTAASAATRSEYALSADEKTLLIAGVGYLFAIAIWAMSLQAQARTLLRRLSEIVEPTLWQSLGAPSRVKDVFQDPGKRWFKFLRSGDYRRRLSSTAIELIDDYRRRTKIMLAVATAGGLLLLIRFWPLLKPGFL
jgi:hypothetical protein